MEALGLDKEGILNKAPNKEGGAEQRNVGRGVRGRAQPAVGRRHGVSPSAHGIVSVACAHCCRTHQLGSAVKEGPQRVALQSL